MYIYIYIHRRHFYWGGGNISRSFPCGVYLEKCLQGEAEVILRNGQIANYHQPSTKEYMLVSLSVSTAISYHQMLLNLTHGAFN